MPWAGWVCESRTSYEQCHTSVQLQGGLRWRWYWLPGNFSLQISILYIWQGYRRLSIKIMSLGSSLQKFRRLGPRMYMSWVKYQTKCLFQLEIYFWYQRKGLCMEWWISKRMFRHWWMQTWKSVEFHTSNDKLSDWWFTSRLYWK